MADLPILFSGPMVRALLAGTKTQTRRIINPQPKLAPHHEPVRVEQRGDRRWIWMVHTDRPSYQFATGNWQSRFAIGDRLYVREAWRVAKSYNDEPPRDIQWHVPVHYVADGGATNSLDTLAAMAGRFRQGMHMPRWASRITLTVTDVRVQRLQDISEEDALAEGIVEIPDVPGITHGVYLAAANICGGRSAVQAYRALWTIINDKPGVLAGDTSWDKNPWVAAYTFTVERANIDSVGKAA